MSRLLAGDCRDVLATLPADSVQCVVTSPPYYGLRDYGTAQWDGGDAGCDHVAGMARQDTERETPGGRGGSFRGGELQYRDTCGKCGATRVDRQIGLEATPDEYLATMVAVFREVRRVLRPDGTCFVNMGDSYVSAPSGSRGDVGTFRNGRAYQANGRGVSDGQLAAKQLLMMPARLALALQADGWWLRSDIIWHKPNPMPESCRDRPTSAHEHVFLLTKSARYYYDADAVREAQETASPDHPSYRAIVQAGRGSPNGVERQMLRGQQFGVRTTSLVKELDPRGRNLRNVWTIATAPYSEAHFATFAPALAERCIKAGTSERGCCSQCGKPWVRITDTSYTDANRGMVGNQRKAVTDARVMHAGREDDVRMDKHVTTTGWRAGCDHEAPVVPCTVLDPFAGAGTTLLVADRLQRDAIGIELNTAYTEMAMQRCRDDAPLFADMPPAADPEDERMADLFAEAAE